MASYPSDKTRSTWLKNNKWLVLLRRKKWFAKFAAGMLKHLGYQVSTVNAHGISNPHDLEVKAKENADAKKEGILLPPRKVVLMTPTDSAIAKGLQKMGDHKRDTVTRLHEIAFYIAIAGPSVYNVYSAQITSCPQISHKRRSNG